MYMYMLCYLDGVEAPPRRKALKGTNIYMHIYIYICIYAYMHIYIYICIYTYILYVHVHVRRLLNELCIKNT